MTSFDVQTAVKIILPGELGVHANQEGQKATIKYMSWTKYG
eukprot:CAMPEP_0202970808 /NCGR_PEP_ID=MMETSP1396-20130829/20573_1 /ASSEMBLY_ACC=CAM_ASM_000872 /TAXON_ID= /ORGANISM="Pseudokeronopsis sp., Strain Brazil" /LENGTH=40 /DNA_ID= /DNA_START= /DNA_END= /DNA_ORIENTATION=